MDCDFGLQNDWNKIFRSLFHDLDHRLAQKGGLNCYYADASYPGFYSTLIMIVTSQ